MKLHVQLKGERQNEKAEICESRHETAKACADSCLCSPAFFSSASILGEFLFYLLRVHFMNQSYSPLIRISLPDERAGLSQRP